MTYNLQGKRITSENLAGQVSTTAWQTNYAAQVGRPATRTRYDQLGRVIARVDQLGNTASTTYSPDGRTVFVRNPNTSTRVTARSASRDTISITGSTEWRKTESFSSFVLDDAIV